MKYKVAVIETYREVVDVDAESEEEALSLIWDRYQEEDSLGGDVELEDVRIELN